MSKLLRVFQLRKPQEYCLGIPHQYIGKEILKNGGLKEKSRHHELIAKFPYICDEINQFLSELVL